MNIDSCLDTNLISVFSKKNIMNTELNCQKRLKKQKSVYKNNKKYIHIFNRLNFSPRDANFQMFDN